MITWGTRWGVAIAVAGLLGGVAQAAPFGRAQELIAHYAMEKIPVEGCWFKVTYGSTEQLAAEALAPRYGAPRAVGSAIYALLTREDFSALHKLKTDEIWHYYAGEPIELLLLHPDGRDAVVILGTDFSAGQQPQYTVPAGVWMGARPLKATADAYSFFGTTMAPGFDYADFEPGYRDELQKAYPVRRDLVAQLTREELATRPAATTPAPTAPAGAEPTVFSPTAVSPVPFAAGVELRELVGRVGYAKTTRTSIAHFTLAAGKSTGRSYNKLGEEYFVVLKGQGTAVVGTESSKVRAGDVVFLKPGVPHSLAAATDSELEFYAVSTPAFSPDDYVPVTEVK